MCRASWSAWIAARPATDRGAEGGHYCRRPTSVARAMQGCEGARRRMSTSPRIQKFVNDDKKRIHQSSIDEIHEKQDRGEPRLELVDVRDEDAWRGGHIPGARHLAEGVL